LVEIVSYFDFSPPLTTPAALTILLVLHEFGDRFARLADDYFLSLQNSLYQFIKLHFGLMYVRDLHSPHLLEYELDSDNITAVTARTGVTANY
jgi:hypothetical protein